MILLILGLALWAGAHLFKRLAPDARARMGDRGKGLVTLLLLVSLVLMITGFRGWDAPVWWGRHPATVGINNLLMLLAVYLYAASGLRTRLAARIRHPQLTAVKTWALAHLLVNGDLASIVLFGGLMAWAVVEVIVINRATPDWTPPAPAPMSKEIIAIVATLAIFTVIVLIHTWLGYSPFG